MQLLSHYCTLSVGTELPLDTYKNSPRHKYLRSVFVKFTVVLTKMEKTVQGRFMSHLRYIIFQMSPHAGKTKLWLSVRFIVYCPTYLFAHMIFTKFGDVL